MNNIANIKKIEYRDNYYIIYSDKEYYVKEISYDIDNTFNYFREINFYNYKESLDDKKLIYDIDSNFIGKKNGEELIKVLVSLQEKSCIEREYNDNEKNEFYDKIHSMIDERIKYYLAIQDKIDDYDFPPPAYYLLVKNISKFYKLLQYGFSKLEEWFNNSNNDYREVFLIEDISFDNFYVGEESFFLDYGKDKRGL